MKTRLLLFIAILLFACNAPKPADHSQQTTDRGALNAASRNALTPDSVVDILKAGNVNFYKFKLSPQNDSLRIAETAGDQFPMAAVLSCLDSRVPVERVFDQGIGDLFVARVAGNISNVDMLGSLEYACRVVGARVILVLGHENCGAVKAAITGVKLGNITALLAKIKPAVDSVQTDGERNAENKQFVHDVAVKNVVFTIKNIRSQSPILDSLEVDKKIRIIGGMYDVANGKISFFEVPR